MVKRVRCSGEATSSTTMRTLISKSTGGSTGGGAVTPQQTNSGDNAANTTAYTTWSGQPTLASGGPLYNEGWNAFGGGFDLTLDGREIWLVGTEQLSIRNTVGTGVLDIDVEIAEP